MSRPTAFIRHAVSRWRHGKDTDRGRFSEAGDTLVEVLLSIVILGIAATALLTGFAVAITSSGNHRALTTLDASVRNATDAAIAQVQQNQAKAFGSCPDTYASQLVGLSLGNSFTITNATVQYWSNSADNFASTNPCTLYGPQQWALTVSNSGSGAANPYTATTSTVIYDPTVPPNTQVPGTPTQLVWLQTPTTGIVNSPVSPQPEIAVEDANGDIVTNDFSSVTLKVQSGPGTLSSTCSGVESYGVVPFGDCSLSAAGTYQLAAFDSNLGTTAFPAPSTFVVSPAPPAKLVFLTSAVTGTASSSASLGPITVQEQDAFGNPTTSPVTVTLTSSSGGAAFATGSGGPTSSTLQLTIPNGSSTSSASFYYGDTVAGYPMITATSNGLAPATQVETINPGPATKLAFTTQPATGQNIQAKGTGSFSVGVAVEDSFGNTETGDNATTVTLAINNNPSGGVLTCTGGLGPQTVTAGVATFTGCAITKVGTGYTLKASSNPARTAPANANAFNITAGSAATIVVSSGSGQSATVGATFTSPLVALVTDTNGNPVPLATVTFTPPGSGASATITGGNTAVTNAQGLATSGTLTANGTAGSYGVSASAPGTSTVNFSETNNPSTATKLTFTTQPTAGSSIQATGTGTFNVSVAVQDASGNTETGDNTTTVTVAINNNPSGGVLTCTGGLGPKTVTAGVANFTGCAITKTGTGYTLTASSNPAHTAPANANAFNITAGAAATIAVSSGSGQSATAGAAFTNPLVALVTDANGNPVPLATVTFTPPGSGASATIGGGNTAVTNAQGLATSGTVTANATAGTYNIGAAAAGTGTVNFSETNNVGPATKLTFTTQPTAGQNIQATGTGTFNVSVAVQDAGGNTETGDNTTTVTLAIGTNPSAGVLSCAGGLGPQTVASGVATFTGCAITKTGTGYKLTATSNPARTAPANANAFNITAGTATNLTFTTQPTSGQNIQATGTGTFNASVAVQDANGNTVLTDNRNVTLAIGSNPSFGVLSCTDTGGLTVAAASGVANFTGCAITKVGTGYLLTATSNPALTVPLNPNAFNITAGAAHTIAVSSGSGQSATVGAAFTNPLVALVTDANGNPVANATVTFTPPGSGASATIGGGNTALTTASGLATSGTLTANTTAGTYNVAAASPGTNSVNFAETNNPGTATKLTFTTQPTVNQNIQATGTGTFNVSVAVQDANGNTETGDNATTVTLAINNNPSGGVLTCTGGLGPQTVTAGVANFTGCAITKTGTGYTLTATSNPARTAPTNANAFNITAGTATALTFTTQPTVNQNIQATGTGTFNASVAVQDANGNTETGDNATTVTLAINNNPSGGVLTCTGGLGPQTVTAGVANFTGCAITKVGTGYTLKASSNPAHTAPANANAFNITVGTAATIAVSSGSGQSATVGAAFTNPLVALVTDANGNPVANATVTFTPPGSGASATIGGGNTALTNASGLATSGTLTANTTAGTYNVAASSTGTGTVNFAETNNPGTPTKLTFTTQPTVNQNIQATGTGTFNASVAVQDANGNTETGDNATTVTLAINNNPSGGVLTCTSGLGPQTVTAGVANFTGCAITKVGTGYTLKASSNPTRTAPTNANAFNITAGTASTIAVSSGSGQSATVGAAFTNPLVALVTDANGNPVANATVTFTPPGSGASATIGGGNTALTTASGLATSGTLTANTTAGTYNVAAAAPGTNSVNFAETNNPGTATKLTFTTQPTVNQNIQATGTGTFNASVAVQDANGNTETGDNATTVTLAINNNPSGGVLTCTGGLGPQTVTAGVANFTGCAITKTGTGYTLTATSNPARTAPTNANAFNITAGTATALTFTTQPTVNQNIQATGTGTFNASVAVQDANGNTVLTDTRNVTLAIGSNPSFGVLSCTDTGGLTVAAASGVANFTGCAITKTGTGYLLTASSNPALTVPLNANAFNITAGTATALTFTTQPTVGQNIQATGTGTFNASVAVQDTNGNTETGDNATTVTLAIGTNPSAGVLTCTGGLGPKTVTAGVAAFTGCAITKTGTGYTLKASSNPAHTAPTNANAFDITAGTAASIAVSSGSGQSATVSTAFANPLVALVTDANGNPVSGATVTFTPPGSGASATIGGGNTALTNASGLATSGTLTANATAGTYNVAAAATGTNSVNFAETNKAAGIAFVQQNSITPAANVTSVTPTLTSGVTAGDALILTIADQSSNSAIVSSVSGGGVTWVKATSTGTTANGDAEVWYGLDSSGTSGSTAITVTLNHSTNVQIANVSEWSGVATTGALDKTNNANNTTASISAGSVTPTVSGELIISDAYLLNGNATQPTPTNGFTSLTQMPGGGGNYRGYAAYLVDGSTSSTSTTWTEPGGAGGSWAAAVATFEP